MDIILKNALNNQEVRIPEKNVKLVVVHSFNIYKVMVSKNRFFLVYYDDQLLKFVNRNIQLDFFTPVSDSIDKAETNKERGMKQSIDNANKKHPGWSDQALETFVLFLKKIKKGETFLTEDVREFGKMNNLLPEPPSNTAWGSITKKIRNMSLIEHAGFSQTKNPKAHKNIVSIWMKV